MKIFVLDDNPNRVYAFKQAIPAGKGHSILVTHGVATARTAWDNSYDILLLDHDLGSHTGEGLTNPSLLTGYGFSHYISHMIDPNTLAVITSHNPVGAEAMYKELLGKCNVVKEPFGERLLRALQKL